MKLGSSMSAESRRKISNTLIGIKRSPEHREKIRKARLGTKQTPETIAKMRLANLGRKLSEDTKKKISLGNKGRFVSSETRQKMSEAGKRYVCSNETRMKLSLANIGKKASIETRKKRSESEKKRREFHWNWQGGINKVNIKIRKSFEMRIWREAVFARDDWTCVFCLQRGGKLNADHIKSFARYPELRFAIDNGRTLCVPCHRKTDTWGSKSRTR